MKCIKSVRTSQRTKAVSTAKTDLLMLFREMVGADSCNCTKHLLQYLSTVVSIKYDVMW
jgi:hypothetical protein